MSDRDRSRDASDPPRATNGSAEPSFEEALRRLETIVDRLEEGDLELESALAVFEEGVVLTRRCAEQLEDAERRIEVLAREGDRLVARPFDPSEESGDESGEFEEQD